ncbi:synaptotagmin-4-like isoform X2 [Ruditapes philippinarum]|uniref:synaptotagmin-4-like isoform X2 n=1 Tax=Ruditapes philippinarum TaxID=129788 RepID=UPI00295A9E99|nr:synaptotagmin-4-like isoform X2 [Ruditapes philippinarum]
MVHVVPDFKDATANGEHKILVSTPRNVVTASHENNTVTLVLCLSGATVLIASLLLVAFLILMKRRRCRKNLKALKYDNMFTTLSRPVYSVVGTRRQLSAPNSRTSYSSFDETKEIKVTDLELSQYRESKSRQNKDHLKKYPSLDGQSNKPASKGMKRSKSMVARLSMEEVENVTISFSLKYSQKLRQLRLKLLRMNDLPLKCYGYDIYVIVYLFPRSTDGVHSRSVVGGKELILNETFLFDDIILAEVDKSTLRLVLMYKKKTRSGKDGFLGETYMECSDVDWSSEAPLQFDCELEKNKIRNGTREKYLLEDLGSLFVCLEYQSVANRMKVMIRKASDLPKSDKLIGRPVHYVTIALMKNNEVIKTQETKSQSGYCPIWNQPFLFDLSGSDVNEYSLDFVIMRGKLHTKDTVVGHVTIGPNGCRSGKLHWKETISPRPADTAKWHSIAPVLGSKPATS